LSKVNQTAQSKPYTATGIFLNMCYCSSQCLKPLVTPQNVFHQEIQGALIHCFIRKECDKC